MHEIVTLQFGQRANYLATHFWNIQESYFTYTPNTEPSIVDHDIHFRPGIGTDGSDTYTPRTVIYDLKGGFGTLRQRNALYADVTGHSSNRPESSAWNDAGLSTIKQMPIQQIAYQKDLDAGLPTTQLRAEQVRYWSDFNRVFYHPRSVVQLNEYSLNSQLTPFENWSAGEELWRDVDREADLLDRDVRFFVEECDSMQGFQVFAGLDDAWGGWTERFVDALKDEFGKKSVWIWGVEETRTSVREKAVGRKANVARSVNGLAKVISGLVRLGTVPNTLPSYVRLDGATEWECTGLMAAAVESVSLPTRLRSSAARGSTMAQFEQILDGGEGRNVWDVGMSLVSDVKGRKLETQTNGRGQIQRESTKDEADQDDATRFDIDFTPSSSELLPNTLSRSERREPRTHAFGQVETIRRPKNTSNGIVPAQPLDHEELIRRRYNEEAIVERFTVPLDFPRLDAYPANLLTPRDDTRHTQERSFSAGFMTSSTTKQNMLELRDLVTRFNRAVAVDEREELYNGLTEVAEKYGFGWDDDASSEDE